MLRGDIYAVAALTGAAVVIIGSMLHFRSAAATIVGAALCFGLRFTARRGWQLPVARGSKRSRSTSHAPADRTEDGAKKP